MVDGLVVGDDRLRAKVKGERAGANVAGMEYIGYEVGLTQNSIHVLGKQCNADIADEDFRYVVVPLDNVRAVKFTDLTDRGRTVELLLGDADEVALHSEKQTTLGKNLQRLFLLVSRLVS